MSSKGSIKRRNRIAASQAEDPRVKQLKKKNPYIPDLGLPEISVTKILIQTIIFLFIAGVVGFFGTIAYIYFSPNVGRFSDKTDLNHFYLPTGSELYNCAACQIESVNGLNVITAGDRKGELLVFLHGFPETAYLSWHKQIEFFSKLGYFVVAPDQRGYNTSIKFPSYSDYHLNNLSQDIVNLIDHYNRTKANVVGHDWGAAVAWHLGQFHNERLEKLVIINVPHPEVMKQKLRSSLTQLSNSWYMFFFQLPWVSEAKLSKNNYEWLSAAFTMSPPGTFSRSTIDLYKKAWSEPGAITGMLNWYRAALLGSITNKITPRRLPANLPVLMLWGDQDKALDASMAQPSIEMCDNGKLVMFEGISHWVQHEVPDRVNSVISDFLI